MTIKRARERFEEWRKTRKHEHCAVPTELRRIALAIKRRHGGSTTCKALGLSAGSLWNWRKSPVSPHPKLNPKRNVTRPPIEFVEISPLHPLTPPIARSLVVEWVRPDGVSMKASGDIESVDRLARTFWGASS